MTKTYGLVRTMIVDQRTNKTQYTWWSGEAPVNTGVGVLTPFGSTADKTPTFPTKAALVTAVKQAFGKDITRRKNITQGINYHIVCLVDGEPQYPVPAVPENTEAQQFDYSVKLRISHAKRGVESLHRELELAAKLVNEARDAGHDYFRELGFQSWPAYIADRLAPVMEAVNGINERRVVVAMLTEAGMSTRAIGQAVGVSNYTVSMDQQANESSVREPNSDAKVTGLDGRDCRKPKQKRKRKPKPEPSRMTVDEMEAEIDRRVNARLKELEPAFEAAMKAQERAAKVLASRKGLMTKADYLLVLTCLHPDNSASEEKRARAFDFWRNTEVLLLDEKESPMATTRPVEPLPSFEDLIARRKGK